LRTTKDREHQLANDTQSCFSLAQKLVAASNAKQQKAIRLSATLCKTDQQVISSETSKECERRRTDQGKSSFMIAVGQERP